MKVLIKDPELRQYLAAGGGWTANVDEADDFIVTTIAYNFARQRMPSHFEIVLHLPETNELIVFAEGLGRALISLAA
jgi:hypothetical protein